MKVKQTYQMKVITQRNLRLPLKIVSLYTWFKMPTSMMFQSKIKRHDSQRGNFLTTPTWTTTNTSAKSTKTSKTKSKSNRKKVTHLSLRSKLWTFRSLIQNLTLKLTTVGLNLLNLRRSPSLYNDLEMFRHSNLRPPSFLLTTSFQYSTTNFSQSAKKIIWERLILVMISQQSQPRLH